MHACSAGIHTHAVYIHAMSTYMPCLHTYRHGATRVYTSWYVSDPILVCIDHLTCRYRPHWYAVGDLFLFSWHRYTHSVMKVASDFLFLCLEA